LRTLAYGVLLPGPDIGKRAADTMRAARAAGFDVGVHCHDHVLWQDYVMHKDAAWTREQMQRACDAYERVFAERPLSHAAAGWQINEHGLRFEPMLGLRFASDSRGTGPFMPVLDGRPTGCPQLPTTLPTLDELIGRLPTPAAVEAVLQQSRHERSWGHVFTAHAELEGMQLLPLFQQLLATWQREGFEIISMTTLASRLQGAALPQYEIVSGTVAGRSGTLACQGEREVARAVA
jgi:peptidoglycan/xylan/chitin deacetylase (PgdA/CDA1 family)